MQDILVAIGIVDLGANVLGGECSGVIRRVGAKVTHLKVGDRILAMVNVSCATTMHIPGKLCTKIPDKLSFDDAATMPCVYGTVVHGLIDVARMEEHQVCQPLSVLWYRANSF
jgi:NADPH:quinone reductase-like Zn-dependent oxidoreductase